MLSFRRTNRTQRRKGRHGKGTHRRHIQRGGDREGENTPTPSPLEYLTGQAQGLFDTVTGNEPVGDEEDTIGETVDGEIGETGEEAGEYEEEEMGETAEVTEDAGEDGEEEADADEDGEEEADAGEDGEEEADAGEDGEDDADADVGEDGEEMVETDEVTEEVGEEGEKEAEEGGDSLMDTLTQTLLGTPSEVPGEESSSVDPKQDTIVNLMREYHFKDKNICLTKDLPSKMTSDDVMYTRGVEDGKYTKDFGENEPVLVVLYIFPNPLVTGMVISDDSSHLPTGVSLPAGHNAHVQTRKLWVPFPGVQGVHIRINCGVVETMMPVKANEEVTLNKPVGIAMYSGKLGNLEKYYTVEELRDEEKTVVEIGTETVDEADEEE